MAKKSSSGLSTQQANELYAFLHRTITAQQFSRAMFAQAMAGPGYKLDEACGYPAQLEVKDYKDLIDRDGMANRVLNMYPTECFSVKPMVYERENLETDSQTPFELAVQRLFDDTDLLSKLLKFDLGSGLGRYGVLLLGINDKNDPALPFPGIQDDGTNPKPTSHDLYYTTPFTELEVKIAAVERNSSSRRFGKPTHYEITIDDPNSAGMSSGIGKKLKVHWSRVIHTASEGGITSSVYGPPQLENVYNYFLNVKKILGGSAEMFYLGGFPGTSFEVPPELASQVELDKEELKNEIESFISGFKRYIALQGVQAKQLMPNIEDPASHIQVQLQAIAMSKAIPLRIMMGSEEARMASAQDSENWNRRVGRRHTTHVTPNIIRPLIDRLIAMGVVPAPQRPYVIRWPDIYSVSETDRADITGKMVRALSEYVRSGAWRIFPPLQFFHRLMDLTPEEAEEIIYKAQEASESGEFDYLEPLNEDFEEPDTREEGTEREALGDSKKIRSNVSFGGLVDNVQVLRCRRDNQSGYKYGKDGVCYTYTAGDAESRKKALRKVQLQGAAVEAQRRLKAMEEPDGDNQVQETREG